MYKITFPDGWPFTGVYLTVPFAEGMGQTDSDYLAERFAKKGLLVERIGEKKPKKRLPKETETAALVETQAAAVTEDSEEDSASAEEEPTGDQ